MNNKKTSNIFLLISLGLTSAGLLINGFIHKLLDWLGIVVSILAVGALIYHIIVANKKRQ